MQRFLLRPAAHDEQACVNALIPQRRKGVQQQIKALAAFQIPGGDKAERTAVRPSGAARKQGEVDDVGNDARTHAGVCLDTLRKRGAHRHDSRRVGVYLAVRGAQRRLHIGDVHRRGMLRHDAGDGVFFTHPNNAAAQVAEVDMNDLRLSVLADKALHEAREHALTRRREKAHGERSDRRVRTVHRHTVVLKAVYAPVPPAPYRAQIQRREHDLMPPLPQGASLIALEYRAVRVTFVGVGSSDLQYIHTAFLQTEAQSEVYNSSSAASCVVQLKRSNAARRPFSPSCLA